MIKAKPGDSTPKELAKKGNQVARCFEMIHIGTVLESYLGEEKLIDKIRLSFELPRDMRVFKEGDPEKPMVVSKEYTLSMYKKANLRNDLENWRGQKFSDQEADDFDIVKVLGAACMVNIIHTTSKKGVTYANIGTISSMPDGFECPLLINPLVEFNYDDKFDLDFIKRLPDFIKNKIESSHEYKANMLQMEMAEETIKKEAILNNEMGTAVQNDTVKEEKPYVVADKDPGAKVPDDLPF